MIRKYMINGNIPAEIVPTIGRTIVQIGSKWIEEYFWWSEGLGESYLRMYAPELGVKVEKIVRK